MPELDSSDTSNTDTTTTAVDSTTQTTDKGGSPDKSPDKSADTDLISSGNTEGGDVVAPQDWPDTWRELLAGDDTKQLDYLKRLNSPNDLYAKTRNLEKQFSSREPERIALTEDMTDEQKVAFRKQEGVPEKSEDYNLEFDNGLVIGENDKEFVDEYLKFAHEGNQSNDLVKSNLSWYLNNQEQQAEALQQANADYKQENLAKLKGEWGGEFTGNINAIHEIYTDAPEGFSDLLKNSVDARTGLKIGNSQEFVTWASNLARKLNPAATITLPGGESGVQGLETRIGELRAEMRKDLDEWHKRPDLKQELQGLLEKQEQIVKAQRKTA